MDYQPLIERWQDGDLASWADALPGLLERGLSTSRYGDLPRWLAVLENLPNQPVSRRNQRLRLWQTQRQPGHG